MKKIWIQLALLFVAAFALRALYMLLEIPVPLQDTPDYDELALNLLNGEGFVSRQNWHGYAMRSWRPPFYSFFLALVYGIWGYSHAAVQIVQAAVGAATVVLLWFVTRRFHAAAAWPAACLAAVYGPFIIASNEVMSECFFTFWVLLALWALGDEKRRWSLLLVGGLAIGLATLTRPVGLLLLPAFGIAQLWTQRRATWRPVLWVGLTALLTIAPWTLRNYQVHGTLVPVSTHGGFILARSNAAEPAWRQEHGWGIKAEVFRKMPSEVERDRYWFGQAREFVLTHPGAYLRLVGERFLRFWYFFRPSYNFFFALVLPFFLFGFYRYGLRPPFLLSSIFITISTVVFSAVLYGSTRFRLPLEPLFIAYAAAFLTAAWSRWGPRRWAAIVSSVLALNTLVWWREETLRQLLLDVIDGFGLR